MWLHTYASHSSDHNRDGYQQASCCRSGLDKLHFLFASTCDISVAMLISSSSVNGPNDLRKYAVPPCDHFTSRSPLGSEVPLSGNFVMVGFPAIAFDATKSYIAV